MKYFIMFCLTLAFSLQAQNIHEFKVKSAKGGEIKFSQYKDKPILVVNIATQCGYTPQLEKLEALYQKYKGKVNVVGVPSNDFGGQTPQGDKEVVKFCKLNYGVTFPLTTKMVVKGKGKTDLYKYLVGLNNNQEVGWNFEKFLFDKNGNFVSHYRSGEAPLGGELEKAIKKSI